MNMKSIFLAGALALAPMAASASLVIITDGGSTAIGAGETVDFIGTASTDGGAGSFMHTFTVEDGGSGHASVTIGNIVFSAFENLKIAWFDLDDNLLSEKDVTPPETALNTIFVDPDTLSQKLVISWTKSSGTGFDVEGSISAVPVPAGALLLTTALAGLGFARRRRAA